MPNYTLELELFSLLNGTTSDFEIWADGVQFGGGYSVSSAGTTISVSIPYGGALPTSLQFRFDDAAPGSVDQIEVRSVKINNKYVNTGNFLSSNILNNGGSATVDITGADFIFDASEPAASVFTTGATRTLTAGNDTLRVHTSNDPERFDALAGHDRIYLGDGIDEVNGNDGNDIIYGGGGGDLLYGEDGDDRLYGDDGNDRIYGGAGNDRVQGDAGDDEIHGGAGNDRLSGQDGNDIITGGTGEDNINGGDGDDHLFGDDDNDQITGGAGNDTIDGGAGDDLLYGGLGNDIINGGIGNDTLSGNEGADILHGDAGDDDMFGEVGADILYGGAGADYIDGGNDNDTIDGGAGNDILIGGSGADTINGGDDDDIIHGHGLNFQQIYTILKANPSVVFNSETNSFYQYVNTTANYAAALTAAQSAILNGVSGHLVTITSAAENAYVTSLIGGSSWTGATDNVSNTNWVWNGGAEDGANFSSGPTAINGMYENWDGGQPQNNAEHIGVLNTNGTWHDWPDSAAHRYVIEWDAGLMNDDLAIDTLNGGDGNDFIYGYGGNDILSGNAGNDVLFGGEGNDTLNGDTGNDVLYGQSGDDILNGGNGDDYLYASSTSVTLVPLSTQGWFYEYYNLPLAPSNLADAGFTLNGGKDNSYTADGSGMTLTTDPVVFDGTDDYALKFSTTLTIVTGGTYTFRTSSDDGSQLFLNGTMIVNNDGLHGAVAVTSAGQALAAGTYTLEATFFERAGGEVMDITMSGPDTGSVFVNLENYANVNVITYSAFGSDGDDILNGGNDNDTLYGSAGNDTLNGDAGADTIYSGSTITTGISSILTANPEAILNMDGSIMHIYDGTGAHTFTTPFNVTSVDYLIVGGGGGGGGLPSGNTGGGGGGGAGGVLQTTNYAVTGLTDYNITVGAGGNGGVGNSSQGGTGGSSSFDGITAFGGGGGASAGVSNNGSSGASGGGGRLSGNGANGTQGNDGGDGSGATTATAAAGGGGGAGADGANGSGNNGGAGGNGVISSITGVDTYYGGGGGGGAYRGSGSGGAGGLGGGGSAPNARGNGGNAVDGFGGGGGGATGSNGATAHTGGAGGDGVVIVRYDTGAGFDITTLAGGSGNDLLYGSDGMDVFIFSLTGAGNQDTIFNFDQQTDKLDLSDILTGYNPLTHDINAFVRLTEGGGNTTIAVDTNGTTGGASFSNVAVINGVTGMDVDELEMYGILIV